MPEPPHLTDEHRRRWALQVAALREAESGDEGTPEWRTMMVDRANRRRAARGIPPLREWWETKTEPELHHRARALGLLR